LGACGRGGYAGIGTGGPVRRGRGRVRSGLVRSGGSYGEGSRGRCGEGARRSPRARVRARRRCGEGRVEDTWRCSCTITGRCGKTIEVSVRLGTSYTQQTRSLVGNRRGSLRTPGQAIRLARQMQHDACSKQQATEMQLPPCTNAKAKSRKPKPRQRRVNERTMADSDMSVNLAPEAVVATTSGAGG
jgi:hypothetical protein